MTLSSARRRVLIDVPNTPPESPVKNQAPPSKASNKKRPKDVNNSLVVTEMKSDEYWFEDGNLLLTVSRCFFWSGDRRLVSDSDVCTMQCDDLLFLVHQSVLSRLSIKFRETIAKFRVKETPNIQLQVPGNGKSWSMFLSLIYPS